MYGFVLRMLITALGLWMAAAIVPSIEVSGFGTLLAAAILLGVVNAIIRPIIVLMTLPITVLSLGIFLLIINAAMLGLVAALLKGFTVGGFFAAIFGSIIVSLTAWFASSFIGPGGKINVIYTRRN